MLNARQLDLIPGHMLAAKDTQPLLEWLRVRGWQLSLFDLDAERRRRHISPPLRTR